MSMKSLPRSVVSAPFVQASEAPAGSVARNRVRVQVARVWPGPRPVPRRVTARFGTFALVLGLAVYMAALAWVDALVRHFPSVPDVVHERLPYVDFGAPGEWAYATFMLVMAWVLFRRQPRTVPVIFTLLGVFYAMRGLFLFLLPIGSPPTAPGLDERFVFWPFADHAYFPGGHTGMMTVLSLSVARRRWRRAFLAATFVFALGTMIARTHYTADAFGGWLLGYGIVLWGRGRFGSLSGMTEERADPTWRSTSSARVAQAISGSSSGPC